MEGGQAASGAAASDGGGPEENNDDEWEMVERSDVPSPRAVRAMRRDAEGGMPSHAFTSSSSFFFI
jgi:hypothetical protein